MHTTRSCRHSCCIVTKHHEVCTRIGMVLRLIVELYWISVHWNPRSTAHRQSTTWSTAHRTPHHQSTSSTSSTYIQHNTVKEPAHTHEMVPRTPHTSCEPSWEIPMHCIEHAMQERCFGKSRHSRLSQAPSRSSPEARQPARATAWCPKPVAFASLQQACPKHGNACQKHVRAQCFGFREIPSFPSQSSI